MSDISFNPLINIKCRHCESLRYFKNLKIDFFNNLQIHVTNIHCQGCGLEIHYNIEEVPFVFSQGQLAIFNELKERCSRLPEFKQCILEHSHFSGSRHVDRNLDNGDFGESFIVKCTVCNKVLSYRELSPFPDFIMPFLPNGPCRFKYVCTVHFTV